MTGAGDDGRGALSVAHLLEELKLGGAETLAVRLAGARAARGRPTALYGLAPGGALTDRVSPLVRRRELTLSRGSVRRPWSFPFRAVGGRRALAAALRRDHVDVLQTHLPEANFWGLMLTWRPPCAVVATVHSNDEFDYGPEDGTVRRALRRSAYRAICRRCDAVVAVSERVRDSLVRALDLPRELSARIAVVPNGVALPEGGDDDAARARLRRELNIAAGQPVLLGAGRLTALKGFDDLLELTARLRRRGHAVTTLIAGEGEEHAALAAGIEERGLGDAVRLLGARHDLDRLHDLADVFVLCSRWEGLPLVMLEAMAATRPVAAYRIDGTADVITDGREGVLVDPGDVGALAAAVGGLLEDPGRRRRLGAAGRALVAARYDLTRSLEELESVYLDAARRRGQF